MSERKDSTPYKAFQTQSSSRTPLIKLKGTHTREADILCSEGSRGQPGTPEGDSVYRAQAKPVARGSRCPWTPQKRAGPPTAHPSPTLVGCPGVLQGGGGCLLLQSSAQGKVLTETPLALSIFFFLTGTLNTAGPLQITAFVDSHSSAPVFQRPERSPHTQPSRGCEEHVCTSVARRVSGLFHTRVYLPGEPTPPGRGVGRAGAGAGGGRAEQKRRRRPRRKQRAAPLPQRRSSPSPGENRRFPAAPGRRAASRAEAGGAAGAGRRANAAAPPPALRLPPTDPAEDNAEESGTGPAAPHATRPPIPPPTAPSRSPRPGPGSPPAPSRGDPNLL